MCLQAFPHSLVMVLQKEGLSMGDSNGFKNAVGKEEATVLDWQSRGCREQFAIVEEMRHVERS